MASMWPPAFEHIDAPTLAKLKASDSDALAKVAKDISGCAQACTDFFSPAAEQSTEKSIHGLTSSVRKLHEFVQDILVAGVDGAISGDQVVTVLTASRAAVSSDEDRDSAAESDRQFVLGEAIADSVWLIGNALGDKSESSDKRAGALKRIVTLLSRSGICYSRVPQTKGASALMPYQDSAVDVPDSGESAEEVDLIRGSLDHEALAAAGVSALKSSKRAVALANTKMRYVQVKFNMLAEASEGFAKLAAASLAASLAGQPSEQIVPGRSQESPALLARIQTLTGSFRLDPAKAMDLVLAALEGATRQEAEAAAVAAGASAAGRAQGLAASGAGGASRWALQEGSGIDADPVAAQQLVLGAGWREVLGAFRREHLASMVGRRLGQAAGEARAALHGPLEGGSAGAGAAAAAGGARPSRQQLQQARVALAAPCAAAASLLQAGCLAVGDLLPHLAAAASAGGSGAGAGTPVAGDLQAELDRELEDLGVVRIGDRGSSGKGAMTQGTHRHADACPSHLASTATAVQGTMRGHAAAPSLGELDATSVSVALLAALLRLAALEMCQRGHQYTRSGSAWVSACVLVRVMSAPAWRAQGLGLPVEPAALPSISTGLCSLARALLAPAYGALSATGTVVADSSGDSAAPGPVLCAWSRRAGAPGAGASGTLGGSGGSAAMEDDDSEGGALQEESDLAIAGPGALHPAKDAASAAASLWPVLEALGPHVSNDPVLLTRLLRCAASSLAGCGQGASACSGSLLKKTHRQEQLASPVHRRWWLSALHRVLLPGCFLSGANVGVQAYLWTCLQQLPWYARFAVYERVALSYAQHSSSVFDGGREALFQGLVLEDGAAALLGWSELEMEKREEELQQAAMDPLDGAPDSDVGAGAAAAFEGMGGAMSVSVARWPLAALPLGKAVSREREQELDYKDAARAGDAKEGAEQEQEVEQDNGADRPLVGGAAAVRLAVHCLRCAASRGHKAVSQAFKRVAKDTMRRAARAIGKASRAFPLPVCDALVGSLESMGNLTETGMEALRFMTPQSLDVLVFALARRLASDEPNEGGASVAHGGYREAGALGSRDAFGEDGHSASRWMHALAGLTAWLARKFPSQSIAPLLAVVQRRLLAGSLSHLVVLREVMAVAGGVPPLGQLNPSQAKAMGGSLALEESTAVGVLRGGPSRDSMAAVRAVLAYGLRAAPAADDVPQLEHRAKGGAGGRPLLEVPGGFVMSLQVLAAQARDGAAWSERARHGSLRSAAESQDAARMVSDQLLGFVHRQREQQQSQRQGAGLDPVLLARVTPPLHVLCGPPSSGGMGLSAASAFALLRPLIRALSAPKRPGSYDWARLSAAAAAEVKKDPSLALGAAVVEPGKDLSTDILQAGRALCQRVLSTEWPQASAPLEGALRRVAGSNGPRLSADGSPLPAWVLASEFALGSPLLEESARLCGCVPAGLWAPRELCGQVDEAGGAASGEDGPEHKPRTFPGGGVLHPGLFAWFWGLDLFDLSCPTDVYDERVEALVADAARLQQEADDYISGRAQGTAGFGQAMGNSEEDRMTPEERQRAARERLEDKAARESLARQIRIDKPEHASHALRVQRRLIACLSSGQLTPNAPPMLADLPAALTRSCFLPRAAQGPHEAIYAARFLLLMHRSNTPRFSTIRALMMVFRTGAPRLLASTPREARAIGQFMRVILGAMQRWRDSEPLFRKEALGDGGKAKYPRLVGFDVRAGVPCTHKRYLEIHQLCHRDLHLALTSPFRVEAGEDGRGRGPRQPLVMLKSALIGMTTLSGVFPTRPEHIREQLRLLEGFVEREEARRSSGDYRAELPPMCFSFISALKEQLKQLGAAGEEGGQDSAPVGPGRSMSRPGVSSVSASRDRDGNGGAGGRSEDRWHGRDHRGRETGGHAARYEASSSRARAPEDEDGLREQAREAARRRRERRPSEADRQDTAPVAGQKRSVADRDRDVPVGKGGSVQGLRVSGADTGAAPSPSPRARDVRIGGGGAGDRLPSRDRDGRQSRERARSSDRNGAGDRDRDRDRDFGRGRERREYPDRGSSREQGGRAEGGFASRGARDGDRGGRDARGRPGQAAEGDRWEARGAGARKEEGRDRDRDGGRDWDRDGGRSKRRRLDVQEGGSSSSSGRRDREKEGERGRGDSVRRHDTATTKDSRGSGRSSERDRDRGGAGGEEHGGGGGGGGKRKKRGRGFRR